MMMKFITQITGVEMMAEKYQYYPEPEVKKSLVGRIFLTKISNQSSVFSQYYAEACNE